LTEAVKNCQTAENVVKLINELLAESMAQYNYTMQNNGVPWCHNYINKIRAIILHKYD